MSAFTQPNEDAVPLDIGSVTGGKRYGFLDEIQKSYNETYNLYSQYGAESALWKMEQDNAQKIRDKGGQPPISLDIQFPAPESGIPGIGGAYQNYLERYYPYTAAWRGQIDLAEKNKRLQQLKIEYPDAGIQTYDEMMTTIRGQVSDNARRLQEHSSTIGGDIGYFVGGMAASVDPRVNPVNFVMALAGGAGLAKGAILRALEQGGFQGVSSLISAYTGEHENIKFLTGKEPTTEETLLQAGQQALYGVGGQALAEAARFGVGAVRRKWFQRTTPTDIPPPPPKPPEAAPPVLGRPSAGVPEIRAPLTPVQREADLAVTQAVRDVVGTSRTAMRTAKADFFEVRSQMADMNGPQPWEIRPPTHTRTYAPGEVITPEVSFQNSTPDEIARRIDPETFRVYDKLAKIQQDARDSLMRFAATREIAIGQETAPLDKQIAELQNKLVDANKRTTKRIAPRLSELQKERERILTERRAADTPQMAQARSIVQRADFSMRDIAPAVSRAYARAHGEWIANEAMKADVNSMLSEARATLEPKASIHLTHPVGDAELNAWLHQDRSPQTFIPELQSPTAKPVAPGEDAAKVVGEEQSLQIKAQHEQATALVEGAIKTLDTPDVPITVPGHDTPLALDDEIFIKDDNGSLVKLTIRDLLKDVQEHSGMLQAVSACSIQTVT